jgi:hypothetical protein
MAVIIIYFIYSIFWCIGFDVYRLGKLTLSGLLVAITLGWVIMPMSYGTERAKKIDGN